MIISHQVSKIMLLIVLLLDFLVPRFPSVCPESKNSGKEMGAKALQL